MINTPINFRALCFFVPTLLLAAAPPTQGQNYVLVDQDFTQNGGIYTIDPPSPRGLFISNSSNPLFRLTGVASTVGIEGLVVGWQEDEFGSLEIHGASVLTNSGSVLLTAFGPGDVFQVFRGRGYIGFLEGSSGTATVTGTDSRWVNDGSLYVGDYGSGTLTIESGGFVSNLNSFVGTRSSGVGVATVSGSGSTWESSGQLQVGVFGNGTLQVQDGGLVSSNATFIGANGGANGEAVISGSGSSLVSATEIHVGFQGEGKLIIELGGTATSVAGFIGTFTTGSGNPFPGGDGHVIVRDAGSEWNMTGSLNVGWRRPALLEIQDGGVVTSGTSAIGANTTMSSAGNGNVSVTGAGSEWFVDGNLYLGGQELAVSNAATGTLSIGDGGTVEVTGTTVIHDNNPSSINLLSGGTFIVHDFDPTGGTFNWTGGTLVLQGDYTGDLSVTTGATLSGTGLVDGDLVNDGLVTPGLSPGVLSVNGDFTQNPNGVLQFEIGGLLADLEHDVLFVNGTAGMGGLVSIILIDGFAPQLGDSFSLLNFQDFVDNGYGFDFSSAALNSGLSWDTSLFSVNGVLLITPEPTKLFLVGLGALVLLLRRRR